MPEHSDDATSVALSMLPAGRIFETGTGWRGTKTREHHWFSHAACIAYDDGSVTWLPDTTQIWEIRLGGWKPASAKEVTNALPV